MSESALTIASSKALVNGMAMPLFGLGTWRSDKGKVATAVEVALKHGYLHLDCAHVYCNQEEVGAGLKAAAEAGIPRERIFITSKIWNTDHRPELVRPAVEQIVRDLGVEVVDLILIHWPASFRPGTDLLPVLEKREDGTQVMATEEVPLIDTWRALEACVDAGLVKAIGVSNFSAAQVEEVWSAARIKPVANQVELHPYFNQAELREAMAAKGIVVMSYSPLGNVDPRQPCCLDDEVVKRIAAKHSRSPAQILIRWNMQLGNVVIPKSVTPERVVENATVFDFSLDEEDMRDINALGARSVRMVNPAFLAGGKRVFDA